MLSYTFVRLGYTSCTFSEKEVACEVVTHLVMNYFTVFRTDNISFFTFVYNVVFQKSKNKSQCFEKLNPFPPSGKISAEVTVDLGSLSGDILNFWSKNKISSYINRYSVIIQTTAHI